MFIPHEWKMLLIIHSVQQIDERLIKIYLFNRFEKKHSPFMGICNLAVYKTRAKPRIHYLCKYLYQVFGMRAIMTE